MKRFFIAFLIVALIPLTVNAARLIPRLELKQQKILADGSVAWKRTYLTDRYVKKVTVKENLYNGRFDVKISFNKSGARLFKQITKRNIGKPIGIFIDGELISVPIVADMITGGEAVITGDFSRKEAEDIAGKIKR